MNNLHLNEYFSFRRKLNLTSTFLRDKETFIDSDAKNSTLEHYILSDLRYDFISLSIYRISMRITVHNNSLNDSSVTTCY